MSSELVSLVMSRVRRSLPVLPTTSWRRGGRQPRVMVWLRGLMELLTVGEAAHYRAKTGRLYMDCQSGGSCLMAACESVEVPSDGGGYSTLWLCTTHAAWYRRQIELEERRARAQLGKAPGGRVRRQQVALLNSGQYLTDVDET